MLKAHFVYYLLMGKKRKPRHGFQDFSIQVAPHKKSLMGKKRTRYASSVMGQICTSFYDIRHYREAF
jgi:hypothetical protein